MIAKERITSMATNKTENLNALLLQVMTEYFSKSETNRNILRSLLNDAENKNFGKFSLRLYLCATEKHANASPMRYRILPLESGDSGFISVSADMLKKIVNGK